MYFHIQSEIYFRIGGESLQVVVNNYVVLWFKGKELNMVFGLQLSFSRFGSTVNFWVMGPIYKWMANYYSGFECLGVTLFIGLYIYSFTICSSLYCYISFILFLQWYVGLCSSCYDLFRIIIMWYNIGLDGLQGWENTWTTRRKCEWRAIPSFWYQTFQISILVTFSNLCGLLFSNLSIYSLGKVSSKSCVFLLFNIITIIDYFDCFRQSMIF